jgi:hypothetical protein
MTFIIHATKASQEITHIRSTALVAVVVARVLASDGCRRVFSIRPTRLRSPDKFHDPARFCLGGLSVGTNALHGLLSFDRAVEMT